MSGEGNYDLFVIGGGINGAGIARDAAGRGYRVGLAEMNDLASGTSSGATKLIHGGLRYLEHGELRLVRESLLEREVLLGRAPHLIRPLRFVIPHGGGVCLRRSQSILRRLFPCDEAVAAENLLEETARVRLLNVGDLFRGARGDDIPTAIAALRTHVDDIVRALDHV